MKLKAIYEAINGKIVGKKLKEAGSFQGDRDALSDCLGREAQAEAEEYGTVNSTLFYSGPDEEPEYGGDPDQGKLNFPENRKKFGSKLSENYKRFFGTPKPIKEKRAIKLSLEQRNRLSNLSRNLAIKYPNAPITIREGDIYFGYKKIEPADVFLNRSALSIAEMVRAFSNSGKKGLV